MLPVIASAIRSPAFCVRKKWSKYVNQITVCLDLSYMCRIGVAIYWYNHMNSSNVTETQLSATLGWERCINYIKTGPRNLIKFLTQNNDFNLVLLPYYGALIKIMWRKRTRNQRLLYVIQKLRNIWQLGSTISLSIEKPT